MKTIMTILLLTTGFLLNAQNVRMQESDPKLEEEAKELVLKYDNQLGLTETQILKMETKVEEYMINAKKIRNSEMPTKKKINELKRNYALESQAMDDILTEPQLDMYKKLKSKYQPIEPVTVGQVADQ